MVVRVADRREAVEQALPHGRPALEVRGLTKRYGSRVVLAGVDLVVHPGELVALIGENGAGKSTLVQCVAGTLGADGGEIRIDGGRRAVATVWQDLALCDNLDAVANLFLGRERGAVWLSDAEMHVHARTLLARLGIVLDDLRRPVRLLSGGERQSLAVARALLEQPRLLVLDEPTASLGISETRTVEGIVRQRRNAGDAVLLVSHRIEQVIGLADRVVVLRHGRIVGNLPASEVNADDLVALMSGVATDTTRRQIQRLRSLVDQLAEVEPSASLPLIVSSLAAAVGIDELCVHLVDSDRDGPPMLVRRAAVGVPDPILARNEMLPVGAGGGLVGLAAEQGAVVVTEDVRRHPAWSGFRDAAAAAGVLSAWAIPIVDSHGVLGVISAYADAVGRPRQAQLELVSLYTNLAAAAIERERLLEDATRRNRVLESLRTMLELLAGPVAATGGGGMVAALAALCRGVAADAVALFGPSPTVATGPVGESPSDIALAALTAAAERVLAHPVDHTRIAGDRVLAVPLVAPQGRLVLAAWWESARAIGRDAAALLDDAARSLSLAVEREEVDRAHAEAETAVQSQRLQREFLSRLSHELRTPLTAIQGFASTLRQTDVAWDEASQERFLDRIVSESARMGRLVADLLDSSSIDAGGLRLDRDWCDVGLAIEAAVACVTAGPGAIQVDVAPDLPLAWVDHDRLEQVVVNLVDNAVRHGPPDGPVRVEARRVGDDIVVTVQDTGPGFPAELAGRAFDPYVRGDSAGPGAGLGLAICRGIVHAHGGSISVVVSEAGGRVRVMLPIEAESADVG